MRHAIVELVNSVCGLLCCVGPILLVVWLFKRTRTRTLPPAPAACASRLAQMRQAAYESGRRLLQVQDVYQVAERGSKAFVIDFATREGFVAWFWCWTPARGARRRGGLIRPRRASQLARPLHLYIGDPIGHGVLAAMTAVKLHVALTAAPWLP
ncbi:MAG: hypothetical protein ACRC20_04755 [Segniliparus sp.]|uniref:hypothetical protein n=1 Tax=Segniliparus sp. TaxID=2804064 RepID=UPI003F30467D